MIAYNDWMMTLYKKRMMNDKNSRSVPDARLIVKKKLSLEQKGAQRRKNESRLALSLKEGGGQRKRNEIRLALALGQRLGGT